MALITCPDCGKEFSDAAPACPHCGRPRTVPLLKRQYSLSGCLGVGCLGLIVISVIGSLAGKGISDSSTSARVFSTPAAPAYQAPQLELQSWNWHTEYGYAIAEGRVKNISGESLKNVQAVVTFSRKNGDFITTDDALIDLNPILPGQTSSFKVMATENPAMGSANVDFKELMGGSVSWRAKTKKR